MNSTQATKPRSLRNSLAVLRSPDKRIRLDVQKAVRYVAQRLEGEKLQTFSFELAVLLTKWEMNTPAQEAAQR